MRHLNPMLQGSWLCVSAVVNGKALAPETVTQLHLKLTGDRYRTEKGKDVLFDSNYKIDASASPKRIDMIGTEGALAGRAAEGIFCLDGDVLTLCYTMPGANRPAAFESLEGSGIYLTVWKREPR